MTRQQLQAKHGTPAEFKRAVLNAVGEISLSEAENAIRLYEREWNAASASDPHGTEAKDTGNE